MVEFIRAPHIIGQARWLAGRVDGVGGVRFGLVLVHVRTMMQARRRCLLRPDLSARQPSAYATGNTRSPEPSKNGPPRPSLRPEASHCASPSRPSGVPRPLHAELECRPIVLRKAIAGLLKQIVLCAAFSDARADQGAYRKSPSRLGSAFPLRTSLGFDITSKRIRIFLAKPVNGI